jgi:hypothetical protein
MAVRPPAASPAGDIENHRPQATQRNDQARKRRTGSQVEGQESDDGYDGSPPDGKQEAGQIDRRRQGANLEGSQASGS